MLTREEYDEIAPQLVEALAKAFEAVLLSMGKDALGVDWFSSIAKTYEGGK